MDFRELLADLNIDTAPEGHHHGRDGWINFDCPFCGAGTSKYHMGLNTRGGYVNCWLCGPHNLVETLAELSGNPQSRIKHFLKNVERPRYQQQTEHTGVLREPRGVRPLMRAHREYLRGRDLSVKDMKRLWNLGGIGLHPQLQWRIYIPITYLGRVVSWTTRSLSDHGTRYISAPSQDEAIPHKSLLFGEDYCRHACIVHEGPFDVFRTGPGAVCTCGAGYSRSQILRISKYPRRVICYDNEPEAQRRARAICDELEPFPGETLNVVLDSKDAGSATPKETRYLRSLLDAA